MEEHFQIKLSSEEILVVAALLGYESVFGVENRSFLNGGSETKKTIREIVYKLEQKKLIRYDLDGTLYIVPGLRKAIECVCEAETVGLFSADLKSGKRNLVYVFSKNDSVYLLENIKEEKYVIRLADPFWLTEVMPYGRFTPKHYEMDESLLFEEAEYLCGQIEAFNYEEAEMRIQERVRSSDSVKTIARILSGHCGYMSVQIYCKGRRLYRVVYHAFLSVVDSHVISMYSDRNDVLHFETADTASVDRQISLYFDFCKKRGAV